MHFGAISVKIGFGYYRRARQIHATAKFIALKLKGCFSTSYEVLLQLEGNGQFTEVRDKNTFCHRLYRWNDIFTDFCSPKICENIVPPV
jgi:hypothetical protein